MKAALYGVLAVLVLVAIGAGYWFWSLQQAAVQWDNAKEIYSESIEREGQTWKVRMQSLIDNPIDQVWTAVQQPERMAEFIDSFKKSELKSAEGNKKVVELSIQVLTLPAQSATVEFTFDAANHRVSTKTLAAAAQDIEAEYRLEPSPDGTKTLFTYDARATDKINVPLPVSAQKGAMKELFVKTVRAIKKGIEEEQAKTPKAA